jgi:hypothetical protein
MIPMVWTSVSHPAAYAGRNESPRGSGGQWPIGTVPQAAHVVFLASCEWCGPIATPTQLPRLVMRSEVPIVAIETEPVRGVQEMIVTEEIRGKES